jgi:hypothetical protein
MLTRRARSLGVVSAVLLLLSSCDWHSVTGVQWQDVASWKSLGSRWASAYSKDGRRIAIFDLSYPGFQDEIPLGILGSHRIRASDAAGAIRAALASRPELAATPDAAALAAYARRLEAGPSGTPVDALPDRWWENLKWRAGSVPKNQPRTQNDAAPDTFSLADLDLETMAKDKEKLAAAVAKLESLPESTGGPPLLGPGFLSSFRFRRNSDGGYDLGWKPGAGTWVSRPRKMIDFTLLYSGLIEDGAMQAAEDALGDLIGLIPIPIGAALLDTALGRFFHAHGVMTGIHTGMLFELARQADEGMGALSELVPAEILGADSWLEYTSRGLDEIPLWFIKKPEAVWKSDGKDEIKQAGKGLAWLSKHGYAATEFNPRFAQAERKTHHYFFSTSVQAHWLSDRPELSLHEEAVEQTRADREFEEILSTAVSFASHFMPIGGGVLTFAYGHLVEDPIDRAKYWEGRLKISMLESDPARWATEVQLLDEQKVNPLELSAPAAADLVETRKEWLGLPH